MIQFLKPWLIELNTGGDRSRRTLNGLNREFIARQLPIHVVQRNRNWFLRLGKRLHAYRDGMIIDLGENR